MVDNAGDQDQDEKVGDQGQDPEEMRHVVDARDLKEEDQPQAKKDLVAIGNDVWVSELVDLQNVQGGNHIHESGVKLVVLLGGADMVAGTEETLQLKDKHLKNVRLM